MKIEQELLGATEQKAKDKKESDQDFLVRIALAVSEIDEPKYDALSEQAQDWFTQAAAALNEEPEAPENIQAFEKFDEAVEEVEQDPPEPKKKTVAKPAKKEPAQVTTPDKGKKAKTDAAAVNAVAAKEKKAAAKTGVKRENSVADTIRVLLCENTDATKDEIGKELKVRKLSFDPVRLTHIYSTTARVIEILRSLKKLK